MPKNRKELVLQLQNGSYVIRRQAAIELCDLAHCGQVEASDLQAVLVVLLEILDGPDSIWHSNAAFMIGRIGQSAQAAIPHLIKRLQDQDELVLTDGGLVLMNVCYALGQMGKLAKASVVPMTEWLRDPYFENPFIAPNILSALGFMGDSASSAVPRTTELLTHPSSMIRTAAALALGGIGRSSVTALSKLIELLNDSDATTRMSAAVGLRGMQELAYEAVPALIHSLKDPDWNVRIAVVLALVTIDETGKSALLEVTELINQATSSELEMLTFWLHPPQGSSASWAYNLITQLMA